MVLGGSLHWIFQMFFTYFFRELFNPNSDSYLDMNSAIESGFNKYISLI